MRFKTLDWIRKVRDEDYEKTKDMSPKEKIKYTQKMAREFSKKCFVKPSDGSRKVK